jgi:CHASE3 domain sensor protein
MNKKLVKFMIIINAILFMVALVSYIDLIESEKELQELEIEANKLNICILQIQLGEDHECF